MLLTCLLFLIVVGDYNGHLGLGQKCAKEVAGAIRGALIDAKINTIVSFSFSHFSTAVVSDD